MGNLLATNPMTVIRRTLMAGFAAFGIGASAHAQTGNTVLIDQAIPPEFDRGRNVGVVERARPDYDELGIVRGSFIVYPSVDISPGVSDNVFLTDTQRRADAFLVVAPRVEAVSQWDRDQVRLVAIGNFQRFVTTPERNQDGFDLRALGTKEIGDAFSVTGQVQLAQLYESPNNGITNSSTAVLSHYLQFYLTTRAQYTSGRTRIIGAYDHYGLAFADIPVINLSQADRDRTFNRITGEFQYAKTPSIAFYTQGSFDAIDYSRRLFSGAENRNSLGWRLIGGANFDIPGSIRGRVGLGYVERYYRSSLYRDTGGLAAEAQLEFFVTPLTTLSASAARVIEDTNVGTGGAFFDNRFSVGVDHELLANLIVSGRAEYRLQTIQGTPQTANFYAATASARYLVSRFVWLTSNLSYSKRTVQNGGVGYDEARFLVGIRFQR